VAHKIEKGTNEYIVEYIPTDIGMYNLLLFYFIFDIKRNHQIGNSSHFY